MLQPLVHFHYIPTIITLYTGTAAQYVLLSVHCVVRWTTDGASHLPVCGMQQLYISENLSRHRTVKDPRRGECNTSGWLEGTYTLLKMAGL